MGAKKYSILLFALCIGILVGVTFFTPTITGKSVCFVENERCTCNEIECVCGNNTIPASHCLETNQLSK